MVQRRQRHILLAALLALGSCDSAATPDAPAAVTDELVAEATLGPVAARVHMTPAAPRFGEKVRFRLEITAQPEAELEAPEIPARLGHFRVRGHDYDGKAEDGRLTYRITTEAEKTGANICRFPKISFRVTSGEGAGTDRDLVLDPFDVEVAGMGPAEIPNLDDMGMPLPPVQLPVATAGSRGLWIALGAVSILLAGLGWWWRRHHTSTEAAPPATDPGEEAAAAFAALLALDLVARGEYAEFYVQLTGIVRRFIERTTGLHAPEETTDEFLREMEGHPAFDAEQQRGLRSFLEASDLVKFAAQVPSETEIGTAVDTARSFCGLDRPQPEAAA